jgi:hypothetical protein
VSPQLVAVENAVSSLTIQENIAVATSCRVAQVLVPGSSSCMPDQNGDHDLIGQRSPARPSPTGAPLKVPRTRVITQHWDDQADEPDQWRATGDHRTDERVAVRSRPERLNVFRADPPARWSDPESRQLTTRRLAQRRWSRGARPRGKKDITKRPSQVMLPAELPARQSACYWPGIRYLVRVAVVQRVEIVPLVDEVLEVLNRWFVVPLSFERRPRPGELP